MKFKKQLEDHKVEEWSSKYIDYKKLKKIIASIVQAQQKSDQDAADKAEENFVSTLDYERKKINEFYEDEVANYSLHIAELSTALGNSEKPKLGKKDPGELLEELTKTESQLLAMEKFILINDTGFLKILKKHYKYTGIKIHEEYLFKSSFQNIDSLVHTLNMKKVLLDKVHRNPGLLKNPNSPSSANSPNIFAEEVETNTVNEQSDKLLEDVPLNPEEENGGKKSDEGDEGTEEVEERPAKWRAYLYMIAIYLTQVGNTSIQTTMSLLFLNISSPVLAALASALTSFCDGVGAAIVGRLMTRFSVKSLALISAATRTAVMLIVAILYKTMGEGATTSAFFAFLALYSLEALSRGFTDGIRATMPYLFVGKEKSDLDVFNSMYQFAFEGGGLSGPFIAGAIMGTSSFGASNFVAPACYMATVVLFCFLPNFNTAAIFKPEKGKKRLSVIETFKFIIKSPLIWPPFLGVAVLQTHRLKSIIPGVLAKEVLHSQISTSWLVGIFGVGGVTGSFLYGRFLRNKAASHTWMLMAAFGLLLLGWGWVPSDLLADKSANWAFVPYFGLLFVYTVLNVIARVSMNSTLQVSVPKHESANIMSLSRSGAEMSGFILKLCITVILAIKINVASQFVIFGCFITVLALVQVAFWYFLKKNTASSTSVEVDMENTESNRVSPKHGYPGRLIVVEGLDGSGKSTQLDLLKETLEAQGMDPILIRWNSSPLVANIIKRTKRAREMTPEVFTMLQATDLAETTNKIIIPHLKAGRIILSDRYFFTSLARDFVRGNDRAWLRSVFGFSVQPDLALYFRTPVDVAISRVLARRGQPTASLSDDYASDEDSPGKDINENKAAEPGSNLNFYEAGLDLKLSDDPHVNFHKFQQMVASEYDRMSPEFGFLVLNANRPIEEQHNEVMKVVYEKLGNPNFYRKQIPPGESIFSKDPSKDPPHVVKNYTKSDRGVVFFFRNALEKMRVRLDQLFSLKDTPVVFVHGNPHIDNYAKTLKGTGMVDFDRSCYGPYIWDLVRFAVSMSFRQSVPCPAELLPASVLQSLKDGYLTGLKNPDKFFPGMSYLENIKPKEAEESVNAYLEANLSWAKQLRSNRVLSDNPEISFLLQKFFANRNELQVLVDCWVEEAGYLKSSVSEQSRWRYLIVLAPRDPNSTQDRIFLDIKEVRKDPDTKLFHASFSHQGERMMLGSTLYAPHMSDREGFLTYKGKQYYGRAIPTQNVKLKKKLTVEELCDLSRAVGAQLGKGHAKSVQKPFTVEDIINDLEENYAHLVGECGLQIKKEIVLTHRKYLQDLRDANK